MNQIASTTKGAAPPTLPQSLRDWAQRHPGKVAIRQKEYGIWQPRTWAEYYDTSRLFGLGLIDLGARRGENIAILCENRYEWVFSQVGVGMMGGVVAGIYPTSPAPEVEYLIALSQAPIVICEDQEQLDKVLEIRSRLPELRTIIVIDPRGLRNYDKTGIHTYDDVIARGRQRDATHPGELEACIAAQNPDDIALIVFTSGSTGRPKAAMMSWRSLHAAASGLNSGLSCTTHDQLVSYLPLCHVAEQMFSVFVPIQTGAVVNFAESLRTVQEDVREMAPRVFFGVPRIWEKFHAGIQTKLTQAGGLRLWLYNRMLESTEGFRGKPRSQWSLVQNLIWCFWYPLILRPLVNFVGLRHCRIAVSSGAPVAPEILYFFRFLGVPVREAYGLTEASGATTMQMSEESPVGSAGSPYPGVELKLAEDGEILIRGDMVFKGYYRNSEATAEAIDAEGWLHTGDVARWEDGAQTELRIIDRKKDIMITAGGKNISPSEIENALRFSPYISQAIIVADRRRFVSALLQIEFDAVSAWAESRNLAFTNYRSLAEMPEVRDLIQAEVDKVNDAMPRVQQVRKFHIFVKELDHDDGEVTATMKIKRKSITEAYTDVIEAIYA
ncbi:AMP-dependent synthetase/ligase [Ferrovibrio sp.]|uniref:AMP-dependent synthetase/ligase n=1 Tax=Ferrovibrio sp. TaxID=1917215 RepID=UPI003D0A1608